MRCGNYFKIELTFLRSGMSGKRRWEINEPISGLKGQLNPKPTFKPIIIP